MFVRNPLCVGSNTPAPVCGLVYAPSMEDGDPVLEISFGPPTADFGSILVMHKMLHV